jgi:hypothetical protein
MLNHILLFSGVILYAYGEGKTEAISFEWRDRYSSKDPYEYHMLRLIESVGILCFLFASPNFRALLLFPLYLILYRIFFCIERNQSPLWKAIGKQLEWQDKVYQLLFFGTRYHITFPSNITQIVATIIGTTLYFI